MMTSGSSLSCFKTGPFDQPGRKDGGPETVPSTGSSIWAAALCAAGCTAKAVGKSVRINWQPAKGRLRYTATDDVIIEPFGVRLGPGETLEVRWIPGETGYSTGVRSKRMH